MNGAAVTSSAMKRVKKVLVANRGEIAIRVFRACREMGIKTVAVYSDADRNAKHVRMADEAVWIGPPEPLRSYLDGPRIIAAAKETGASAIHPGYGFLSENAGFAKLVEDAGIIWIGPPSRAIAALGNKLEVRKLAKSLGVPTVPGTENAVEGEEALRAARQVGFPVLLKAASGGGGKGIRLVKDESELLRDLERARGEAKSSFGSSAVFVEKAVAPARHVEVQVIADSHGNVIHLGERECSLQRRHQKIVEESPSTVVTPELRTRLGECAVKLAASAGYRSAGTVEFLVDERLNFYLLEMNTRLQVEHPVTELCTGLDLVRLQLLVADGERLPVRQEDVRHRGAAIELRVTAEDPFANFAPSAGKITGVELPNGPFTRVDSALEEGAEVSLFYDPLVAKLIVWAEDRQHAIDRLVRAAEEFHLTGVKTTLPLVPLLANDPDFRKGDFHVTWLDPWVARAAEKEPVDLETVALVAALAAHRDAGRGARPLETTAANGPSPWAMAGRPRS